MLKILAVLGLFLGIGHGGWTLIPRDGGKQSQPPKTEQESPKSVQRSRRDLKEEIDTHEQKSSSHAKSSGYPWKELLAPANVPNWVLAVVAGIAAWMAYKTLRAIKRQADTMDAQAKDSRSSADQTYAILKEQNENLFLSAKAATANALAVDESARAALTQIRVMKDRERARLVIRLIEKPEISGPVAIADGYCALQVRTFVENVGRSKAFRVTVRGQLNIISSPEQGYWEPGFKQPFPQIVDEGTEKHLLKLGGFGREFEDVASTSEYLFIPPETVDQLRTGEAFIQATGLIGYEDIFGEELTTPFRFIWKSVGDDDGGKWLTRSFWLDCTPLLDKEDETKNSN